MEAKQALEIIDMLCQQLRQDAYEFATLSPRLTPQFRKSVDKVRANIAAAITAAGRQP